MADVSFMTPDKASEILSEYFIDEKPFTIMFDERDLGYLIKFVFIVFEKEKMMVISLKDPTLFFHSLIVNGM